jgi:hypothetical protein
LDLNNVSGREDSNPCPSSCSKNSIRANDREAAALSLLPHRDGKDQWQALFWSHEFLDVPVRNENKVKMSVNQA